jgi:MFS family permease
MSANRTSEKGFYGWVNVFVVSVVGIFGGFYLVAFGTLLPYLVDEFHWSRGTASLAATINMIALAVCGPLAGFFIVKFGAKRSILLGNVLGCAGFLLLFVHTKLWELFLGWGVLIGLAAGFGGLLALTTVINNWFAKKRAFALSLYLGSGTAAGMILGPTTFWLIETSGWRVTVLAMSCLILLFGIIVPAIFIRNKPQDLGQKPDGPEESGPVSKSRGMPPSLTYKTPVDFTAAEAMRTKCLWLLIAYFCLNMLAMGALMNHQTAHLFDIGIGRTITGFVISVMTGMMTVSQLSVGFLGKKFSMHAIAVGGEILKIAGLGILLFTHTLTFALVYMVVLGLGFGAAMAATMNIFPNYFGISNYPKIMGTARFFWAFVGGAGAPLAGYFRESAGSYFPAFRVAIVIIAAGLICLIFAKPPVHPSLKKETALEGEEAASLA